MIIKWPINKIVGDVYVSPSGSKWRWNGKAWVSMRSADAATGITYKFSHSPMDPVDNMDYYIGDISDSPAQSSNSIFSKRVKSLVDGKVSQVSLMTQILGELGSGESQTFILKNHTKGTNSVITSEYSHTTNSQLDNFTLSAPLDVSAGDEIYIIWRIAYFAISPIGVRHNFNIYVG